MLAYISALMFTTKNLYKFSPRYTVYWQNYIVVASNKIPGFIYFSKIFHLGSYTTCGPFASHSRQTKCINTDDGSGTQTSDLDRSGCMCHKIYVRFDQRSPHKGSTQDFTSLYRSVASHNAYEDRSGMSFLYLDSF